MEVIDIGLCGTEEVYFATSHLQADGGVTVSHNPKDYNGIKLVREESKPIPGDTGLWEIQRLAEEVFVEPQRHKEEQKIGKIKALTKNAFPLCLCAFVVKGF